MERHRALLVVVGDVYSVEEINIDFCIFISPGHKNLKFVLTI